MSIATISMEAATLPSAPPLDYSERVLDTHLLAPYTGAGSVPVGIAEEVETFIHYLGGEQAPERFRNGYQQLGDLMTRPLVIGDSAVTVQFNPMRVRNTVDHKKQVLEGRPCFLDPSNLLEGELGLEYHDDYLIFGNLNPYLNGHLVIVNKSHSPQNLGPLLPAALSLAEDLPGHYIFYNGPEVGATAPDHLHLQAGHSNVIPMMKDLRSWDAQRSARNPSPELDVYVPDNQARSVIVVRGMERDSIQRGVNKIVEGLVSTSDLDLLDINFAAVRSRNLLHALIFPRTGFRHPDYFRDEHQLRISPAAIELSGVWIAPNIDDYHRVTPQDILKILEHVIPPAEVLRREVGKLAIA